MAKKAIVGEKLGMTQVWDDANNVVPVTVLRVTPARVVQLRTPERDGYSALQVTYGNRTPEAQQADGGAVRGRRGGPGCHAARAAHRRRRRVPGGPGARRRPVRRRRARRRDRRQQGQGLRRAMKRHGFGGAPASHGAHRVHRKPGAIGQCATPSRVFKGMRMAVRMGADQVTTLKLEVVSADAERGVVLVRAQCPAPAAAS